MIESHKLGKITPQSDAMDTSQTNLIHTDPSRKSLSVIVAALFIAGDLAGVGILALPYAIEQTGIVGIFLIVFFGGTAAYTGYILGHAWDIVEERYETELGGHTPDPYPILGEKSFGKAGRIIVQVCNYTAIFGGCVVFLLMAADLSSDAVKDIGGVKFSPCYLVLIIGAILIPLSWLGTPVDFWQFGVAALISTLIASFLVAGYTIYLRVDVASSVVHKDIDVEGFFLAMGSIAFTFSGHPSFPTIQQDMAQKSKFGLSAIIAFTFVVCIYLLITITTYILIGDLSTTNILVTLSTIKPAWPITVSEILLLLHLVTCYLVVLNPLSQDVERLFHVQKSFGIGRILVRTFIILCIMFTAESIPRFGVLLALVGGTAVTVIIIVLPVCMYEKLCRQRGLGWDYVGVKWYRTLFHLLILGLALVLIVASTYGALQQITNPDSFVPPCYVNISAAHF